MDKKLKVLNKNKFDVGVKTSYGVPGINIKSNSFAMMSEEEIGYVASTSSLFSRGILTVEQADDVLMAVGIDVATDPNFVSDEEIKKKLAGAPKKIDEWLNTITEKHVIDRIFDIAVSMNLTMSKVKVLQEHMPDHSFTE